MNPCPRPAGPDPAAELAGLLVAARARLDGLLAAGCDGPREEVPPCLDELHRYLLEELVPLLHALRLRVRPVLRRHLGREAGGAAVLPADAVLTRLVERVALLHATYPAASDAPGGPGAAHAELDPLLHRLAEHAAHRLDLEQRTLPVLVGALPADVAAAAVAGVRRTADAVRGAPRDDLAASAL